MAVAFSPQEGGEVEHLFDEFQRGQLAAQEASRAKQIFAAADRLARASLIDDELLDIIPVMEAPELTRLGINAYIQGLRSEAAQRNVSRLQDDAAHLFKGRLISVK